MPRVTGAIIPTSSSDTYATHHDIYGVGGHRTVADTTERDAISVARRKAGMTVYVVSNSTKYKLGNDLTTWTADVNSGGDMLVADYDPNGNGDKVAKAELADDSNELGNQIPAYYLSRTNHTGTQAQATITNLVSDLAAKIPTSEIGISVAPLVGLVIPSIYLPFTSLIWKGAYNALTNTPALTDGTGTLNFWYRISVANPTMNLGSRIQPAAVGDWLVHNGTIWENTGATGQFIPTAGDYNAGMITYTPGGVPAVSNVQAAIDALAATVAGLSIGSSGWVLTTKTVSATILPSQNLVLCNGTTITLTLPTAAAFGAGILIVQDISGLAGDNPIGFITQGGDLMQPDNDTSGVLLAENSGTVMLISNGSNTWRPIF
jgi:hypothetical protein